MQKTTFINRLISCLNNKKVYTLVFLVLITYFLSFLNAYFFMNNLISLIVLFLILFFLFLFKNGKRLYYLVSLLFINTILKVSFFGTSLITIVLVLFSMYEFVLFLINFFITSSTNNRKLFPAFIGLLFLVIYVLILWLFVKQGRPSFNRIVSFIITLSFFYSLFLYIRRKSLSFQNDFKENLMLSTFFSFLLSSVFAFPTFFVSKFGQNFYEFSGSREYSRFIVRNSGLPFDIIRFSSTSQDPNMYGFIALIMVAVVLVNLPFFVKKTNRLVAILLLIVPSLFVFITFSKMAIVILILLFFIEFLFRVIVHIKNTKRLNLTIASVLLIIATIILFLFKDSMTLLFARFSEGQMIDFETTINALTTYRLFVSKEIVSAIMTNVSSFLFGTGVESAFFMSSYERLSHNMIIELLNYLGIIGSIIFTVFIFLSLNTLSISSGLGVEYKKTRTLHNTFILLVPLLSTLFLPIIADHLLFVLVFFFIPVQLLDNDKRSLEYEKKT